MSQVKFQWQIGLMIITWIDMRNSVDLRTLPAFVAVAREGSFIRAAEQSRNTQPAVTLQLKRLARETGVILFRRVSTDLSLTWEEALLAAKGGAGSGGAYRFRPDGGTPQFPRAGTLRIGTIIDPEFTRLGAFPKALIESGPEIETTRRHGMSAVVAISPICATIEGCILSDGP